MDIRNETESVVAAGAIHTNDSFRISMAAARVNARMTQDEAAAQLHVTKQTLVNWEKGKTQPKIDQAENMSRIYGIPYNRIIFLPSETN